MRERGLRQTEVAHLKLHGSPGCIIYSWAARILKSLVVSGALRPEQADRIETNISVVRGLAAKQIAYTITQIPLVYFHIMSMCVHSFLLAAAWKNSLDFTISRNKDCTLGDDDGLVYKTCWNGFSVMVIMGHVWLIYLFVGLHMAAVWMADPMGTYAANYNMEVDLKSLWDEALNVIRGSLLCEFDIGIPAVQADVDGTSFTVKDADPIKQGQLFRSVCWSLLPRRSHNHAVGRLLLTDPCNRQPYVQLPTTNTPTHQTHTTHYTHNTLNAW